MAIERVRVGSIENEAVLLEYDLDTNTDKAVTLYYKNSLGIDVDMVVRDGNVEIYRRQLPRQTNSLVSVNIPAGNRPVVVGYGISLDSGVIRSAR